MPYAMESTDSAMEAVRVAVPLLGPSASAAIETATTVAEAEAEAASARDAERALEDALEGTEDEQAAARAPADPIVEQKLLQAHAASGDDRALLTFLRARPASEDAIERQRLRRATEHRAAPVRVDTGAVYTVTEREDWGAFSLVASGRPHPRWTLHAGSQWQQRGASPALRDT